MKTVTFDETKWKLVPIKPIEEMTIKGSESKHNFNFDFPSDFEEWSGCKQGHYIANRCYEAMIAVAPEPNEAKENQGQPYGIVDPDYARVYTQARIIAWQYGYSCLMHGSFTRDLDLLLVPWEESSTNNHDQLIKLIADSCDLRFSDGKENPIYSKVDWTNKPHGRKSCSLFFKGHSDRRWIDIAVLSVKPRLEDAILSAPEHKEE